MESAPIMTMTLTTIIAERAQYTSSREKVTPNDSTRRQTSSLEITNGQQCSPSLFLSCLPLSLHSPRLTVWYEGWRIILRYGKAETVVLDRWSLLLRLRFVLHASQQRQPVPGHGG